MCKMELDQDERGERDFFLQLVYVGLLHFCNFSALNYFVKSIVASVCGIIVLILYSPLTCLMGSKPNLSSNLSSSIQGNLNSSYWENDLHVGHDDSSPTNILFGETILSILMLLGLVWMLNREFEKAYRVTFHCSRLSTKDRRQILNLKNQADWLLHNIIPKHVHESLKR